MELIRGYHNLKQRHRGCVLSIGNYDGVHRGHQALLARLAERQAEHGVPSMVQVFEPTPQEVFRPDAAAPRIHTLGDNSDNVRSTVVHVEGDPDSPINRGALCPKGITLKRFIVNEDRLTRPLHRLPGSSQWQPLSWEAAYERMARLIKQSRDAGFEVDDAQGRRVNRWPNVALIGGCTDTNEVNYLLGKLRFALGIVAYENQARL